MAKRGFLAFILSVAVFAAYAGTAKYVFFFIGDGMGLNQVLGTEMFRAATTGQTGIKPLLFTQFPVTTVATTYSATNGVTDSAAAGTALATGHKTKNGAVGVLEDLQTPVNSVAVWAKNRGCRVGIATSVSIDHATPAAFYAHESGRNNYHAIGCDLYEAGFDFYAGSDFLEPVSKDNTSKPNLYDQAEKYGYTLARGYDDYLRKSKEADKMILFQPEAASKTDRNTIPYAIDRGKDDLTLPQMTRSAIDFLSKDLSKGFFLMVEGGKIDMACHSNDAATAFREVEDFDKAIKIAYDFYLLYPEETLIVVTADHETGGLALGTGAYTLHQEVLENQRVSENKFTRVVNGLRKEAGNHVEWDTIRQALMENFGFWDTLQLTQRQEKRLKDVYERTMKGQNARLEKSEYAQNEPIAAEAKRIINEMATLGWTSGGHSAGYVPVYAIGAGATLFTGRLDNTQIPLKIAEAAEYKKTPTE